MKKEENNFWWHFVLERTKSGRRKGEMDEDEWGDEQQRYSYVINHVNYYGQFYSHINYGCQLWGQNENAIEQTFTLLKMPFDSFYLPNIKDFEWLHYFEESIHQYKTVDL